MIKHLHHIGLSVKNLDQSIKFYEVLGWKVVMRLEKSTLGAKAVFLSKANETNLELWHFKNKRHKVVPIIKNHTAFQTDSLATDLKFFTENGFKIVIPITNGTFVKRYAFVQDKQNNSIELIEPN
jgi:catechol 2,3-dioxygenase-like lactoylglutathione lyase family enzyme